MGKHVIEYYSALKRNEILTHATTWVNLDNMVCEMSQSQKYKILHNLTDIRYLEYADS